MYTVEIHRKAEKEIKELPEDIKRDVIELLIKLQTTPYPFREYDLKKLKGFKNVYRIRIRDYRVSYWISDKLKKIIILEVKRRGQAYKDIKSRIP